MTETLDISSLAPLLPELTLVAGAMLLLMIGAFSREKSAGGISALSIVLLAAVGILVAIAPAERQVLFGGSFVVDGFARFVKLLMLTGSAAALFLALDFLRNAGRGKFEYPVLVLLATAGMMMIVSSGDLISLYLGLELMSLSLYVLAAIDRDNVRSTEAGLKYFVLGALSSGMLLYGASLIYGFTGTVGYGGIAKAAGEGGLGVTFGLVFVLAGLCFKISAVPFHMWTPDVYEGAPTPVTAFFSVGPKGAAMAAILRVFVGGLGVAPFTEKWTLIWAVAAAASMTLGNLVALQQTNIKRMMAYSSIAQAGYVLVGVAASGLQSTEGISSVLFYVMAYAVTNLGIFAILTHMDQEGGWVEIDNYKGLAKRNPLYAWALLLFFVSLIGIPPTVGFVGKFFLFRAAAAAGYLWLALLMAVNSVISVGYYYRVVKVMFLDPSDDPALTPSAGISATVALSLAGVVLFTIFANPFVQWTAQSAALLK